MHHKELIIIWTFVVVGGFPARAEKYPNRAVRQYDGLQFEIATDRYLYQPRETVRMRYSVKTLEDSLVFFFFGDPAFMDFGLYDSSADSLLWYYVNGWFGAAVYPMLTFSEPFRMEAGFDLWRGEYLGELLVSGILGNFYFLPTSVVHYRRYSEGDPEDRLNAFLLKQELASEFQPISSENPLYIERLDIDADQVLGWEELLRFVEGYEWDHFPVDSTQVSVPITVRRANADFNGSGLVDFDDVAQFADRFGAVRADASYEDTFDLDGDGIINFGDFFILSDQFGSTR